MRPRNIGAKLLRTIERWGSQSVDDATREENEHFEDEVRRVARALWPSAGLAGATKVDGHETDGVFLTDDCIHIVEATTSRRKEKAKSDLTKIAKLMRKLGNRDSTRVPRGWFVTRDEPTADQRGIKVARDNNIAILSLNAFQARLVDSREYLSARVNYAFGSVRDPETGDLSPRVKYVPLDIVRRGSPDLVSHKDLSTLVSRGATVVLLGDYGSGKSMTLREVYLQLRNEHIRGGTTRFPVYLNLRDHFGQDDPAEILSRHARTVGFEPGHHLVRAWRAGHVHLLIDGFDEIASISIQGEWQQLRRNRYQAMAAIRQLIDEHPASAGFLIAGRAHFFDSSRERYSALGLPKDAIELTLNEFTSEQIEIYLRHTGLNGRVPSWLPSRPLLVGYLAARGFLTELLADDDHLENASVGEQWDILLDEISRREAMIDPGIDGPTVRRVLERLATLARSSQGGLGSLTPSLIIESFNDVCGFPPNEQNMVLLQRLPGLGFDREDEDTRAFVDETFADACRAGDLIGFLESPFSFPRSALQHVESAVFDVGLSVASHKIGKLGYSDRKLNAALEEACQANAGYMAADIVRLILLSGVAVKNDVWISGVLLPKLDLEGDGNLGRVGFRDCFFSLVELGADTELSALPTFQSCYVDRLDGRISQADLPTGKFDSECVFDTFVGPAETAADVLSLDLPLGARVCITVLKKVYEQAGGGRRENALYRGMDNHARMFVPEVLRVLQSERLLVADRSRRQTIWRGVGAARARVGQLIAAPNATTDSAIKRCGAL